jgi:hypothetical protein
MKPEDKKTLYISIAMIVFLGLVSFWRFNRMNSTEINFSFPSYEETDLSKLDILFSEEGLKDITKELGLKQNQEEKDIIYTRKIVINKIRFDYPSSWIVSEEENIGDKMNILFVAYADKVVYPSSIAVIKIEAESIDDATEIFKKEIEKEGRVSNFSLTKNSETEYLLDISIKYPQNLDGFYQGKIFLLEDIYYMVSVMSFDQELSTPKSLTDYIFSSIQIIK